MWFSPLRPIRKLGTAVVVLLASEIALLALGIVAHIARIHRVGSFFAGRHVSLSSWNTTNGLVGAAEGFGFLVFVACAVVWPIWQFRGQTNVRVFTAGQAKFTPGWAAGWW